MFNIETKLSGDMFEGLARLEAAAGESTLRAAGVAGAALIRDEAKMRAPVKSGVLKANIIIKRAEEKSNGAESQTYLVTVRSGKFGNEGDAFYWRFVENGHSNVRRKPKGSTWKSHRAAMKAEFGDSKTAARPFMRPAYEATKDKAIDAMRDKMREKIAEHLKGGT
jgi:HK97 gp10 family phage protein